MAKLTSDDKEKILADFHTGAYSQRDLAMRYQVSHVTIGKITKGLEPKHRENVTTLIAVKSELKRESYQQVTAIEEVVTKQVERADRVYSIQEKALNKADAMLDQVDNPNDLKTIVELVDKASITLKVSERHAPKNDINLTNAQQNNTEQKRVTIARRSDRTE